jgi:hypothetical protein
VRAVEEVFVGEFSWLGHHGEAIFAVVAMGPNVSDLYGSALPLERPKFLNSIGHFQFPLAPTSGGGAGRQFPASRPSIIMNSVSGQSET